MPTAVSATLTTSAAIRALGGSAGPLPGSATAQMQAGLVRALAAQAGLDEPAGNLLAHINAVAATAGKQTVLEDVALKVLLVLGMERQDNEALDALFSRIASKIDGLTSPEKLVAEIRSGLKALGIPLSDLAQALRNPLGPIAARIAAQAEAPFGNSAKTAAQAATNSYLQQTGVAPERAAQAETMRNLPTRVSGTGLFAQQALQRASDNRSEPLPQRLQQHLQTIFETGRESQNVESPATAPQAALPYDPVEPDKAQQPAAQPASEGDGPMPEAMVAVEPQKPETNAVEARVVAKPLPQATETRPGIVLSDKNQAATRSLQAARGDRIEIDHKDRAPEPGERRLQTLLTLKGIAEVITAVFDTLPASAAPAEAVVRAAEKRVVLPLEGAITEEAQAETADAEAADREKTASIARRPTGHLPAIEEQAASEDPSRSDNAAAAIRSHEQKTQTQAADLAQKAAASPVEALAVPYGYVAVAPAREEFSAAPIDEDEERRRREDQGSDSEADDGDGDQEPRRPRDAYDRIHDPVEDEMVLPRLTRDSSDAERAFAYYQRHGGF